MKKTAPPRNPNRPHWLDDPSVFPPWQAKYLRRLKHCGVLCLDHRPLPISIRRLADAGYVKITPRNLGTFPGRGVPGRGWWEVRLTAAGQKIFPRRPIKAQARSVPSESLK